MTLEIGQLQLKILVKIQADKVLFVAFLREVRELYLPRGANKTPPSPTNEEALDTFKISDYLTIINRLYGYSFLGI